MTKDSKKDYWACDFFLDKVLDAYLIAAAIKMFNLSSKDDDQVTYGVDQGDALIYNCYSHNCFPFCCTSC